MGKSLSICMIVRDEANNLPRALSSVQGLADELIVVDTGSRDATVAVAESLGARVLHFAWIDDFSAARNFGLGHAACDWIMVLDADEVLLSEDHPRVRSLLESGKAEAYLCPVISPLGAGGADVEQSFVTRFWRNDPAYRYTGFMHEDITPAIFARKPDAQIEHAPIRFHHYGYLAAAEAERGKKERNLALIERQVARNPEAPFYRFNLGVEYQRHGRMAEALTQYRQARPAAGGTPWEPKLVKGLIFCLLHLGQWGEAEGEIKQALELFPDFTDLLYLRGIVEVERREFARAAATFGQCAAMGPAPVPPYAGSEEGLGSWKALYALGEAFQGAGRLQEAVEAYEQAHAVRPGWLVPLEATVRCLLGAGVEPGKVRGYLDQRLPRDLALRELATADMLYQGGAAAEALAAIPAAPGREAESWAAYLRGYCRIALNDLEGAAGDLATVEPGDPRHPGALVGMAYCRWHQGDDQGMERVLAELGGDEGVRMQGARLFIDAARRTLAAGVARFPDSGPLRTLLERLRRELP